MPFCRECGFEVETDWLYCPKCNSSQVSSSNNSSNPSVQNSSSKNQDVITQRMMIIDQWNDDIITFQKQQNNYHSLISWIKVVLLALITLTTAGYSNDGFAIHVMLFFGLTFLVIIILVLVVFLSPDYENNIITLKTMIAKGRESILEDSEE